MSTLVDRSAQLVHQCLRKTRPGVADTVRFRGTGVACWRCTGKLEAYYCESGVYALRCANGCAGVFIIDARTPAAAAEEIAGAHVGDIPGADWEGANGDK